MDRLYRQKIRQTQEIIEKLKEEKKEKMLKFDNDILAREKELTQLKQNLQKVNSRTK